MTWRARLATELFGPAAQPLDRRLALAAGFTGAAAATALAPSSPPLHLFALALTALIAFDLFGGLWSNARTKAWRGHRRSCREKTAFAALHPHPFLLAVFLPGYRLLDAGYIWVGTTAGVAIVASLPPSWRLAAALSLSLLSASILLPLMPEPRLAWIPLALLLKLVVAFAARPDGDQ